MGGGGGGGGGGECRKGDGGEDGVGGCLVTINPDRTAREPRTR